LSSLPEDGLALFVMNEEDPIIIEDASQLIIGRHIEGGSISVVDLTGFGAQESGVSRQHVQISAVDGVFSVIDLGSTNGSWLNQRRLLAGKPYRLHNNDLLLLGQLRVSVCFHSEDAIDEVVFNLTDPAISTSLQEQLTLDYVTTAIIPYLQAIVEIQQASDRLRELPPSEVHINALSAVRLEPFIIVNLDGAAEAVRLIEKWLVPWRKVYNLIASSKNAEMEQKLQRSLRQLASKMMMELGVESSAEETDVSNTGLLSPLTLLITSHLVLSTEKESSGETGKAGNGTPAASQQETESESSTSRLKMDPP
jgi:pSer/pThr/pTyr-binding forkhead associated (FHA) protein